MLLIPQHMNKVPLRLVRLSPSGSQHWLVSVQLAGASDRSIHPVGFAIPSKRRGAALRQTTYPQVSFQKCSNGCLARF